VATSGTFTFNLDLSDAMEEAFERAGLELRSGYDYKTARRSLNLMMLEWQNRGLNLWSVEFATQALTAGTNQYQLDGKVLDIVEAFVRTDAGEQNSQFDQSMTRISVSQYSNLSNKLTRSKPLQYYVEKNFNSITINIWPTPDDQETYQFGYYYMERVEDAGSPASNNMDVPARFLPCLVSGLSYQLSLKYPEAIPRAQSLKADYEEQWKLASDSDRNKASLFVAPGGYSF
jgi:hypothetical protein|tara:strand:- start:1532 stop:2224 length:693 start_codon:yes stop_codon:yes gene_type:complete